jgi:kinesin family protein 2/24
MSMLLAYGQTGSGKTFTVTGLEKLIVEKLMDGKLSGQWDIHMCIFEVAGSNMYGQLPTSLHLTIRLYILKYRSPQRTKAN